ncbi:hypothetical protein JAAARDRAFT_245925 [Jaapia argillacea MUCL 33604]|uniref:Uncharacterized protein n=1 Tax=Jaapia argillacea MUCL 33604 TaxID=933084 RepID=A0A067QN92_9AGAM|nr:hypothetical protein JAAARDRAFT_245925 [Jaapia argillacea MUCL 33604]
MAANHPGKLVTASCYKGLVPALLFPHPASPPTFISLFFPPFSLGFLFGLPGCAPGTSFNLYNRRSLFPFIQQAL